MNKDFHREFSKCPCCGSENRFLEQLGNELKTRGLARKEWNFHLDIKQGIVQDKVKASAIPIGSMIPGYSIITDICMDCGSIYAIDITRIEGKMSLAPAPPIPPKNIGGKHIGPFSTS